MQKKNSSALKDVAKNCFIVLKIFLSSLKDTSCSTNNQRSSMKRLDALKSFYQTELLPHLHDIESKRRGVIARLALTAVGSVSVMATLGYYIVSAAQDSLILLTFVPLFALMIVAFYLLFDTVVKGTGFYKNYKRDIIYKLIKFINGALHYDKHRFISQKDFFRSNFFAPVPVDYDGDDHVSGVIDNVKIEFCELEVKFKRDSDKKSYGRAYQFKGIFFAADCPNPFPSDLVIEPKGSVVPAGHILMDIRHGEFNEYFQARLPKPEYSGMADEMLTSDFLSKIVSFKKLMHNEVHISLIYNKLYVGIVHEKDLFEPTVMKTVVNFSDILAHYHDLYYPISIIEYITAHKDFEIVEEHEEQPEAKAVSA